MSHKPRWMRLPAPSQSACVLPVFSMQALELARHALLGSTRTLWEMPGARIVQLAPLQAKARRLAMSAKQDALPLQGLELATHVQRVAIRSIQLLLPWIRAYCAQLAPGGTRQLQV